MNKPVTCWYVYDQQKQDLEFNHISDGFYASAEEPTPVNDFQKAAWQNLEWVPRFALLQNGVVNENVPPPGVKVFKPLQIPAMRWT